MHLEITTHYRLWKLPDSAKYDCPDASLVIVFSLQNEITEASSRMSAEFAHESKGVSLFSSWPQQCTFFSVQFAVADSSCLKKTAA